MQAHRAALAAAHTRREQKIKEGPLVNVDESGWKTDGDRRMLWAVRSPAAPGVVQKMRFRGERGYLRRSDCGSDADTTESVALLPFPTRW